MRAKWSDGVPAHTIGLLGVQNTYDLTSFPILTIKPVNLQKCVDEILWIYQKKSSNVNELNSRIWDQWKREDGTIGKAYGYQIAQKQKYIIDGKEVWINPKVKNFYDFKPEDFRLIDYNTYKFEYFEVAE